MGMMAVCRTILALMILSLGLLLPALGQTPALTPADRVMDTIDQIRNGTLTEKRRYHLADDLSTMVAEADRAGGVDARIVDGLVALLDSPEGFVRTSAAYSLGVLRPRTDRVAAALWRALFQERLRMDCNPPAWVGLVPNKCEPFSVGLPVNTPLDALCGVLVSIGGFPGDSRRGWYECMGLL
jgi:hypothetical protein